MGRLLLLEPQNMSMRGIRLLLLRLLAAFGVCAAGLTVATMPAHAQAYEQAVARFLADSFDDTIEGINGVAASGNALAPSVISALQSGRLLFSAGQKRVFFKDRTDKLFDALTGAEATGAPADDLSPVRINNRVRRIIEGALGSLTLLSPDPAKRLEAAQAVFKSRDESSLLTLEQAIAKETVARIKRAFTEARAAVLLYQSSASEADKIEAVAVIRDRGDQDALSVLRGLPAETAPTVKQFAADAIAAIERSLALWEVAQNSWYGLSLGSVLLLAAIGLAITFGVMGVINMAHGEMVMLGAYTTYVVQDIVRARYPGLFDASLFIAIPLAVSARWLTWANRGLQGAVGVVTVAIGFTTIVETVFA